MVGQKFSFSQLIVFIFLLIIFDQFIKYLFYSNGWSFSLNTGMSFGLFAEWEHLVLVLGVTALVGLSYAFYKSPNKIPFVFLLGGGFSNFIDRFIYGGVVDYIQIWNFPIFNLADIFLNFGLLLILATLFLKKNDSKNKDNK